jgi:hypothetical protein
MHFAGNYLRIQLQSRPGRSTQRNLKTKSQRIHIHSSQRTHLQAHANRHRARIRLQFPANRIQYRLSQRQFMHGRFLH